MSFTVLNLLVLLNTIGVVALWFGAQQRRPRPSKQFLKSLFNSSPIEPTHQAPKSIGDGHASDWGISDGDRVFFNDFENFGSVVNASFVGNDSPWRIQELLETELALGDYSSDGPSYGRRYEIYHNQIRLGTLEIEAMAGEYSTDAPNVRAHIELHNVQLLNFGTIFRLLTPISEYVSKPNSVENYRNRDVFYRELLRILWDAQEDFRFGGEQSWDNLELDFGGTASVYLHHVEIMKRSTSGTHFERTR